MEATEEREKERIERRLGALEREVGRLIDDAYQAQVIELSELKERRGRIEEHGRMLKERLKEIGRRRTDQEQEIRLLEGVEEFCGSIRDALEEPSFETKSLSGNQYLREDELGAGKVNEPQIVLGFLLPAHHQPSRAIKP
jgi:chromosome segregation ATPase